MLVLAGNLPPGMPGDTYARYIRLAQAQGVKTIVDADGEPLRLGVAAAPNLIKPNRAEAERLLGRACRTCRAWSRALGRSRRGVEAVVISMGAQGAVCAQGERAWLAVPHAVERRSTVGSGDSLVAGLAVALASEHDIVEGLRLGTAAGAATAMTPGTALGTAEQVRALLPQVRIEELP